MSKISEVRELEIVEMSIEELEEEMFLDEIGKGYVDGLLKKNWEGI